MTRRVLCAVLMIVLAVSAAWATEERAGMRVGLQVGSDTFVGMLLYAPRVEIGLKAALFVRVSETEAGDGDVKSSDTSYLVFGTHAGYLFASRSGAYNISAGLEGRMGAGLADLEYSPYLRVGPRLALNCQVHRNVLLTGIVHPLWVAFEGYHGSNATNLLVQFPKGVVAVALLF